VFILTSKLSKAPTDDVNEGKVEFPNENVHNTSTSSSEDNSHEATVEQLENKENNDTAIQTVHSGSTPASSAGFSFE
jgi:Tfp pilus assembly major pilin PilA